MPRLGAGLALVLALIAVSGAVSVAQRFGVAEGAGAGIRVPPKDFNGDEHRPVRVDALRSA